MKKIKLAITAMLGAVMLLAICFISCQSPESPHVHNHKKIENGSTFTMVCDCGDKLDGYRIQFVYAEDGSPADADIEVSWIDANGKFTAKTNEFGFVEAPNLSGDSYSIEVNPDTLPVINGLEYLLNTNDFRSQENGIGLTIPLFGVYEPTSSDVMDNINGSDYTFYSIQLNKAYVAEIKNASQEVWYNLQNDGYGKYTVDATLSGDIDVEFERCFGMPPHTFYPDNPDPDTDKTEHNKLTYKVINSDANQNSIFCVKAPNANSYPVTVTFSVSISFVPDDVSVETVSLIKPTFFQTENVEYTYYTTSTDGKNTLIPTQTNSLAPVGVEKYPDVEGSIIIDMTEQQYSGIQLHSDGYYHTSNNQLVFVKLDAPSIFESLTLASYLKDSNPPSFLIYMVAEINEYGFYTRRDNYFGFVQAYAALANSDGLYPLTQEMLDYLTIVAKKEHHEVYELLCTYPTQTSVFTEGLGTEASPFALTLSSQTLGNYKLSIPAGGKVYLTLNGNMNVELTFNSNVKATVGNSSYDEYIVVNGSKTITFETKNGLAQEFVLEIDEYNDPYYLEIGSNKVEAEPSVDYFYEFVAPKAGTFDISVSSSIVTVTITQENDEIITISGTITVTLAEGESLEFTATTELASKIDFNIIITENTLENQE